MTSVFFGFAAGAKLLKEHTTMLVIVVVVVVVVPRCPRFSCEFPRSPKPNFFPEVTCRIRRDFLESLRRSVFSSKRASPRPNLREALNSEFCNVG